jgi:beta-lactamase class A
MKEKIKNFKILVSIVNIVLFLLIFIFVAKINSIYSKYELKINEFKQLKQSLQEYISSISQEDTLVAVYIKNLSTDYTIEINSDIQIPSASLVKIPIMAAVYYLVDRGELSLDEKITYRRKHRCGGSGIIKRFHYGKKFTIKELTELMITISDNVATHMLIDRIGMKKLNEIFRKLKLKNTNINRFVMDIKARNKGIENYTTAEDIGFLLEEIYNGKLISKEASNEMLLILLKQRICDRIPKKLPSYVAVAHKTGLMKDVCHDAGIVYTNNGNFIICVLTQNLQPKFAKEVIANISYMTYCLYDKNAEENIREDNIVNEPSVDNLGNDSGGN